jgi:hypothetical protein
VEWHEMKLGVFYRHEQATRGARGELAEKVMVGWQGEGLELGRRLHWEAQRGGLGRAHDLLAVGDGAPWIWNVVGDRWAGAHQLLDFYHASEHLWALGEALHPQDEAARRIWVETRLHRLRHGQEEAVLAELAALPSPRVPPRDASKWRRRCWRNWPRCPAAGERREKLFVANKTILPAMPGE